MLIVLRNERAMWQMADILPSTNSVPLKKWNALDRTRADERKLCIMYASSAFWWKHGDECTTSERDPFFRAVAHNIIVLHDWQEKKGKIYVRACKYVCAFHFQNNWFHLRAVFIAHTWGIKWHVSKILEREFSGGSICEIKYTRDVKHKVWRVYIKKKKVKQGVNEKKKKKKKNDE